MCYCSNRSQAKFMLPVKHSFITWSARQGIQLVQSSIHHIITLHYWMSSIALYSHVSSVMKFTLRKVATATKLHWPHRPFMKSKLMAFLKLTLKYIPYVTLRLSLQPTITPTWSTSFWKEVVKSFTCIARENILPQFQAVSASLMVRDGSLSLN